MVRLKKTEKAKKEFEEKSKERIKDAVQFLSPTASKGETDDRTQWQKDVLFGRKRKANTESMEAAQPTQKGEANGRAQESGEAGNGDVNEYAHDEEGQKAGRKEG